jgi:hypothetical protein
MISLLLLTLAATTPAHASEPLFGYVYTTDTLPQGHLELEQWITDRDGQAFGHFHHVDMSTEVEYGITDNFQLAAYVNYMYANEAYNSVRGLTEGIEMPWDHDPGMPYSAFRADGLSFEALYRVLSPYIDPVGLAFYLEPELGLYEQGLEMRAIVQKNFLDDTFVLALNLWVEFDREQESNLVVPGSDDLPDGSWSTATYAELDLGASYRFAPHWSVGLEFRNHNEFDGISLAHGDQDHTAFFFGPNIHYAAEKWFFTFSILRQLSAVAYSDDQKAETLDGKIFGDEHTVWDGIRLKVGFPF